MIVRRRFLRRNLHLEITAPVIPTHYELTFAPDLQKESLDISARAVNRQWTAARAWLLRELSA